MSKIFLLATGESINDITDEQWEHIKSHESIGISWFMKKGFEPTYYYSHENGCLPNTNENQSEFSIKKIIENNWKTKVYLGTMHHPNKKFFRIQDTPKIAYLKYKKYLDITECRFSDWLTCFDGKSWTINEDKPPLKFEEVWAKNLNEPLFGFRGTMMCALNLCTVLGYDEIILCGVDLKNGLHFYESEMTDFEKKLTGYDPKKTNHSTQYIYNGVRGVMDIINWIKPNLNIKIISEKSLLYENGFELYEF
jgi:hypothetical protein